MGATPARGGARAEGGWPASPGTRATAVFRLASTAMCVYSARATTVSRSARW